MGGLIILEQIAEEEGPVIEEEAAAAGEAIAAEAETVAADVESAAKAVEADAETLAKEVEAEAEAILNKIEKAIGDEEMDTVEGDCAERSGGGGGSGRGDGGGGKPIHARYNDGTPVYEGEEPTRIKGPDPNANGPHSVLRWDETNGRVYQGREFDADGNPVRDVDMTNPTYPNGAVRPGHPGPPHQHVWEINDPDIGPRSGFKRGGPEPLEK